jgi:uncharacterized protein (DUF2252 family)
MNIIKSADRYEAWLRKQLKGDFDADDIKLKHRKMSEGAFSFLRATYWRWAETIYQACPGLKPRAGGKLSVLAVGDIHVENFGTWRDAEGRLVWGVNDFDEAAEMPYTIDLVRLATSAALAKVLPPKVICDRLLQGYRAGMVAEPPAPFVLDREHEDMRAAFVVDEEERRKFWEKLDPVKIAEDMEKYEKSGRKLKYRPKLRPEGDPPGRHAKVLKRARPDGSVHFTTYARTAGTGSLGRPRFVGVGAWQGDLIVRETKAMVASGWVLEHGGARKLRCEEIARGRHRSADPSLRLHGNVLVRRLSPNDYKIEVEEKTTQKDTAAEEVNLEQDTHRAVAPKALVNAAMLEAMGYDLAAIHRGTDHRRNEIREDLDRRETAWLHDAVLAAKQQVEKDFAAWTEAHPKREKKDKKSKKKAGKKKAG